jgi:hypothetical protein
MHSALNVGFEDLTSFGYEEFYLLGYRSLQSIEIQLTFRRNISPPSSLIACYLLHTCFLLDWFFDPDNVPPNVGRLSADHTVFIPEDRTLRFWISGFCKWLEISWPPERISALQDGWYPWRSVCCWMSDLRDLCEFQSIVALRFG